MTELTRRSFLRGLFTIAAVSVVPATLLQADLPRIVGDGIHDDTAGLQAALDGKPFICEGNVVRGTQSLHIGEGMYRISDTLTVTDNGGPNTVIHDAMFNCSDMQEGPAFYVDLPKADGRHAFITNCIINTAPIGIQLSPATTVLS